MKFKETLFKLILVFLFLSTSLACFGQNHRYRRYDGPRDGNLGLYCILIGGAIWGLGMLIGLGLRKKDGVVEEGQKFFTGVVGLLCIGGAIIVFFGLIMLGF